MSLDYQFLDETVLQQIDYIIQQVAFSQRFVSEVYLES